MLKGGPARSHCSVVLGFLRWTQHSICSLTSAESRGRITSPDLRALINSGCHWPSLPRGRIAGLCSTCFPQRDSDLFPPSCFPVSQLQPVLVPGVIPPQGQDFVFSSHELHEILFTPFLQPAETPLNGSSAPQYFNHSSQFGIIHELAECTTSYHLSC